MPKRRAKKARKPLSLTAWEVQNITHGHSEWLTFKPWPEVQELISRFNVLPGSPRYAEIHSLWKDRNGKTNER